MAEEIEIREVSDIAEFDECIKLQKQVFGLADLEISPRRHLIVSRQAGGWTIGAFMQGKLVGFVHLLVAVRPNDEVIGYSHMMAVAPDYQNKGIGARLKWAQRERALSEGRSFIKWTWEPMRGRNAHFNLNRLGVIVEDYAENFYGTDYGINPNQMVAGPRGIDSDRIIASWYLRSERVGALASGVPPPSLGPPVGTVAIPSNWAAMLRDHPEKGRQEQLRVRENFKRFLAAGLVCAGFDREAVCYLFFERGKL